MNNTTLKVSHAKSGEPFNELFTVNVDLAEDAAQKLGFGVGELGDYEFKDVQFRDPSSTTDTVAVTYQYDALGRRIKKTVDPDGTPARTEFYYDGPQIIEERNGAGAVQATYVYGDGVDEILSMNRASADYYYHADDLGNIVAVTNGAATVVERYDYGEFGEPAFFDGSGSSIGGTAIGNEFPSTAANTTRTPVCTSIVAATWTRRQAGLFPETPSGCTAMQTTSATAKPTSATTPGAAPTRMARAGSMTPLLTIGGRSTRRSMQNTTRSNGSEYTHSGPTTFWRLGAGRVQWRCNGATRTQKCPVR